MDRIVNKIQRGLNQRRVHFLNNTRIRQVARQVALHSPDPIHNPVIFFNASTRLQGMSLNAAFSLLSSWSLRLSGFPVIHFVCRSGISRCIHGTKPGNPEQPPPCSGCITQSRANYAHADVHWFEFHRDETISAEIKDLSVPEMMAYSHVGIPLGELVVPSLRWVMRRFHLKDDQETRFFLREYILSAWVIAQEFAKLIEATSPHAVVVFNGIVYPEAMARWVARQRGIRVITHEVNLQPYSAYFTDEEATFRAIEIPPGFKLNEEGSRRLDAYLEERSQGRFTMAGVRFWSEMKQFDDEFWQQASQFKQVVPIFTNVIFDTSQDHANTVFPHMFAWLDHLLEIIRQHPETLFILRAHPDETRPGKASQESVSDWAAEKHIADLPNVRFLGPDEYVSSYELIQHAKFVLVYTSTIGMEATLLGKLAVCGGRARFNQTPTAHFPSTIEAYQRLVEELLEADDVRVPDQFIENARNFLYFELYRGSLPFEPFLKEDQVWKGYVALKPFDWQALLPENSPALRVFVEGIRQEKKFILGEEDKL